MASLVNRMMRAAKLEVSLYEEIEADPNATGQAATVVALSSIAAGIGMLGQGVLGLVGGIVGALIGWVVWSIIIYVVGAKLLPEPQTRADLGQLLRSLGFASSPGLLRVLGIVPILGGIVVFIVSIWLLVAMVIAVRQSLDYESTGRAILVCLIGWVGYILVQIPLLILGGIANSIAG